MHFILNITLLLLSSSALISASPSRLDRAQRHHKLARRQNEGQAVLKCLDRFSFDLCYPGFTYCTGTSQPVAAGTACVNNAIVLDTEFASSSDEAIPQSASTPTVPVVEFVATSQAPVILAVSLASSSAPASTFTQASSTIITSTTALSSPPAPVPTNAAPVPAPTSAAPTSPTSGGEFAGRGTFFFQEGAFGACGIVHPDSFPLVALSLARYGTLSNNAPDCGRTVLITNTANGKQVSATVADACPGCPSFDSLDLSTGAYDQIADRDTGIIPITWAFTS